MKKKMTPDALKRIERAIIKKEGVIRENSFADRARKAITKKNKTKK